MPATFDKNAEMFTGITSYVRDKEKGGKERIVCDCRINGALFRMTSTITRGASNVRGTVTALDSAGAKMCYTDAKKAERTRAYQDKHPGATEVLKDAYIITCGFTVHTDKDEALKEKTLEKAKQLYSQYIREISEEVQARGIDELNIAEAIYHYSQTFFKVKSLAEYTTEKKAGMLKRIASE